MFVMARIYVQDEITRRHLALSWALRELSKRDHSAVELFLKRYRRVLPSRVNREVGNKLQTGLKNPRR
jgi:hypothetical protein